MRPYFILVFCLLATATLNGAVAYVTEAEAEEGLVVRKESRRTLVSTENGEIVAARVGGENIDGGSYLLHFFTMDPNSLFLPVILHSDMVFYVSTGSGKLSWTDENELKTAYLSCGDVYRLKSGAVFFIQSNLETEAERRRLRITSIFANSNTDQELPIGPYSSIRDLVLGFDKKVLQAAFKVPDDVVQELFDGAKPPAIIHGGSTSERRVWDIETTFLRSLLRSRTYNVFELNKKKGKSSEKLFNLLKEDKDFKNRNGWSTTVTKKKLSALKDTNIGVFMVNLTAGSMMGPHWNPTAAEIAIVLQGRGMIHVVCSGVWNGTECSEDTRFKVEEGDIFFVPKFYPMAQMAFNNETFVFMGFSSTAKTNHPQFLAGQASVLRTLSKDVLARSFNVDNSTMDQLLSSEEDSVILSCVSCAEEELRILEEEREKEREEAREREEEEAREKEEERRREEEEEERQREEEEAKRQEEERKRREEEEEAEAAREREEEERKKEEEEAKREEEERKRSEEEQEAEAEAERKREEEEEAREREEEEAERQEEERQRREKEQEAEAARRREEEERQRQEEEQEAEAARRREEEEAREREEEEAERQEEERRRREEEHEAEAERRREEEEAREREEEEAERQEEERKRRVEAEEARRRKEERKRREEEEEARRRKEERKRQEEEEDERMARREEEERRRREEEVRRREEEQRQVEEEEAEEEEEEERARQREEEEEHRARRHRRSEEEVAAEEERRRQEEERREEEERGPRTQMPWNMIKMVNDVGIWN